MEEKIPGGAGQFHSLGQAELPRLLVEVTKVILGKMPVLGGVAIVENAYEETARIKAIPAEALIEEEIRGGIPYAEPQGMPYFLSLAYRVERFILSRVSAPLGPRTRPSVRSMMWRR